MVLAVAAFAYDPPLANELKALQWYTLADTVQMYVSVDGDCDVEKHSAEGLVEAMMIRSRVRREPGPAILALEVTCLRTANDAYVYMVTPSLYVEVGILQLQIPNFHGVVGISPSPAAIEESIVDSAERVITDLIYAHGQDANSN